MMRSIRVATLLLLFSFGTIPGLFAQVPDNSSFHANNASQDRKVEGSFNQYSASGAKTTPDSSNRDTDDIATFRNYLSTNYPEKKWQIGPARIDSEEIRAVYPNLRFFYVFSGSAPLSGVAPIKTSFSNVARNAKPMRTDATCIVAIDSQGNVTEMSKAGDFNTSLSPVLTPSDAQLAASAILSIYSGAFAPPGPVSKSTISVKRYRDFLNCQMTGATSGFVQFDSEGKCVGLTKIGPTPP